jgi:hypothetical protein
MGIAMTVSVVDEAGRLVVTMKGDRAGFLTIETSRAKALRPPRSNFHPRVGRVAEDKPCVLVGGAAVSRGEALPSTVRFRLRRRPRDRCDRMRRSTPIRTTTVRWQGQLR